MQRAPDSGKIKYILFHIPSSYVQLKTLDIGWNKHSGLEKCKEKADCPANLGFKEQRGSEFPGFPFCIIYPRSAMEKPAEL